MDTPGLLVLDFDGTMTDAEREGAPFRQGYLDDIAALVDRPYDEVDALARGFEAEVAANPGAHGWLFLDRIVAPASVDPYLRIMPVARRILDHFGRLTDALDRSRVLDAILYKYNYGKTEDAPRPGAGALLESLADAPVYIVTNSHTDAVQRKVRAMGAQPDGSNTLEWLAKRVHGRAKKYFIDDAFDAVPEAMTLAGLDRPVLLRRRHYFEVLDALRQAQGAAWTDVVVVGDIFELDLALPFALGARVALMTNAFTPPWETAFLADHPRGSLLTRVEQIAALLG
ncbi:MAG: HAD family hydrolase [Myxococcales bacterium]|nr:HAD family hydrolase [Myxococcales bacterium]